MQHQICDLIVLIFQEENLGVLENLEEYCLDFTCKNKQSNLISIRDCNYLLYKLLR